jgi:hypothetical protein
VTVKLPGHCKSGIGSMAHLLVATNGNGDNGILTCGI